MSAPVTGALGFDQALSLLEAGELRLVGRLPWSSNATFLAELADGERLVPAVYKPRRGERPLWDFPTGSLCQREVAAFLVSEALGWRLVPPTTLREGPLGIGMLQIFVPHDPERHYLALESPDPEAVRRLTAFDVVVNNADRKSGHVLLAEDGALWAIDHGVTFHEEDKLRTVIWEQAGRRLPAALAADLARLAERLETPDGRLARRLAPLLTRGEIAAAARRARRLARAGRFPSADPERRSYPWPPV